MRKHGGTFLTLFILATLLFAMQAASSGRKALASQMYNVTIKGFKFIPDKLEVNVGDTVIWKNKDIVPHIVTSDKLKGKSMDKGESWSYTAKQKGDFQYICKFHPTMKAELIVH